MKFTVPTIEFDIKDYFQIFIEVAKPYTILYFILVCLLMLMTYFNFLLIVYLSLVFLGIILIKNLVVIFRLRKLMLGHYVEVRENEIYVYNNEESNYLLKYNNIKYILINNDYTKFFVITNEESFLMITNVIQNFDDLIAKLKNKNLQFREGVYIESEKILSSYTEL